MSGSSIGCISAPSDKLTTAESGFNRERDAALALRPAANGRPAPRTGWTIVTQVDFISALEGSSAAGNYDLLSAGVMRILMQAVNSIDHDEPRAMEFVRMASDLLQPKIDAGSGDSRTKKTGGLAKWQINRVISFIDHGIAGHIRLAELAKIAKLSTSYFSAAFRASLGMSPHAYILSQRINHAKQKMLETDAPLCEIALDCGMADQAHLSRVFRRMTGATPSAWRRYSRQQ